MKELCSDYSLLFPWKMSSLNIFRKDVIIIQSVVTNLKDTFSYLYNVRKFSSTFEIRHSTYPELSLLNIS